MCDGPLKAGLDNPAAGSEERPPLPRNTLTIATAPEQCQTCKCSFRLIFQAFPRFLPGCQVTPVTVGGDKARLAVGVAELVWYSAIHMDYLWTPWRYTYITTADKAPSC